MPAENGTQAKPPRRFWSDVIPESAEELTRDEVLGRLRKRRVDVTERTLVNWESTGALPRPTRRYREGAPRVFYPTQAVDYAARARDLIYREGVPLRDVYDRLFGLPMSGSSLGSSQSSATLTVADEGAIGAEETATVTRIAAPITAALSVDPRPFLESASADLAERYRRVTGRRLARLVLVLVDESGEVTTVTSPTAG